MIELKVPSRGEIEMQRIKTFTDFQDPMFPRKRMVPLERGTLNLANFPKMNQAMETWYDKWRHSGVDQELDEWVKDYLEPEEQKKEKPPESDLSRRGRELSEARWGRKILDEPIISIP